EGELLCFSVSRFGKGKHKVRRQMKHDASLHFSRVVVSILKELFLIHGVKPVAGAEKHVGIFQAELADHRLEVVPTVAVQNDEFVNALPVQYLHNIIQYL